MAQPILSDEIWELIDALLPERPPQPKGGRPALANRDALTGILFVLKTGITWEDLPREMGCGCGMTCLRRLREWQDSGVWPRVENLLMQSLRGADRYDWPRAWGRGERNHIRLAGGREGFGRDMARGYDNEKVSEGLEV